MYCLESQWHKVGIGLGNGLAVNSYVFIKIVCYGLSFHVQLFVYVIMLMRFFCVPFLNCIFDNLVMYAMWSCFYATKVMVSFHYASEKKLVVRVWIVQAPNHKNIEQNISGAVCMFFYDNITPNK